MKGENTKGDSGGNERQWLAFSSHANTFLKKWRYSNSNLHSPGKIWPSIVVFLVTRSRNIISNLQKTKIRLFFLLSDGSLAARLKSDDWSVRIFVSGSTSQRFRARVILYISWCWPPLWPKNHIKHLIKLNLTSCFCKAIKMMKKEHCTFGICDDLLILL